MEIVKSLIPAALCGLFSAPLMAQACPGGIAGTWSAQVSFGPEARGEIVIARSGTGWRASMGATNATVTVSDPRITVVLDGHRGEFRGRIADRGAQIIGQWIQPSAEHVWGVEYATPVVLRSFGNGMWRGDVRPLDDGETIDLRVARDSTGTWTAFVRNPERNLGRYLGRMSVSCRDRSVAFVRSQRDTLWATFRPEESVLSLYLPTETATFDLTKRLGRDAPGFFPRATAEYSYREPVARADGWPTASLGAVGIDSASMRDWIAEIVRGETKSLDSPFLQGILIARHGRLVLEEYFHGYNADRVHDIRSAGKSLTATLFGVASKLDRTLSVHSRVLDFFPQYASIANDGASKRAMRIEHLLTMTSGLAADDDDPDSPGTEDRLVAKKDRVKFTLDLPMTAEPGTHASYSAATINLVGPIVERSSRMWLPEFIFEHFARPLDIEHYHVPLGQNGDAYMAGGMLMRPRDFMKLGQLFLSNGRWRGRVVLDSSFVAAATTTHSKMGPGDYGYGWWLRDAHVGSRTFRTYRAAGNGGQLVIVIPDLDMVVTFVGGNYNQGPIWWPWNDAYIPNVVIPAARP